MLQDPFIDRADGFGQVLVRLLGKRLLCAILDGGGAFLLRNGGFDGFDDVSGLALRRLADFVRLRLRLLDSFHDFQRQSIHPLSG